MSNETAKCNDQPASERSCPDPAGSGIQDRILKLQNDKRNAGFMGDLEDVRAYEKQIEDLERKLLIQNVELWHPSQRI